ncbi:MAG: prolyl oligopeptidase family serine peptidase [Pyrinomonadaceae bacterium]
MTIIRVSALILFSLCVAACSDDGPGEAQFPSRTVTVNGEVYAYRIYVPPGRDPNEKIPVMLYLHGSGSRGDDNRSQLAMAPVIRENPERFRFIIVFPQCRDGKFWSGEMNQQALAALDATVAEFDGDVDRLYLGGFSMGGNGTWQNGLVHNGKFAALVPIAGQVAPSQKLSDEVLATLAPKLREAAISDDPYKVFAEGIGKTPVWVFHGSDDDLVPVSESRKIAAAFRNADAAQVQFTEYAGDGHQIVGRVFGEPDLFKWLGKQRR